MLVYVKNCKDEPLMPCSPCIARKLLKSGEAKVVSRTPFTIKLLFGSSSYKQEIVAGMDTGSKFIGCAVKSNGKVLYQSEVQIRQDVSKIVVKHCKKHKLNCKRSSATDLSKFNDNSFDLYMSTDVYEHIRAKDLKFAIEEAIRVTSKYFLIRVHTTLDKKGTLHLTVWDLDRWASFFMNNGLKILNFGDGEFNTYKNTFFMEI